MDENFISIISKLLHNSNADPYGGPHLGHLVALHPNTKEIILFRREPPIDV